ncbi:MAG: undecaprenyl/decaprenyl-phosphate alpha-N-acetylglucosaminyl 1-phosphate transferase [Firmicutes bacterium]|nr:undecaprenyl/decaprenyl-phosphate alpha-N-acetylglucosaminyl 1-phosphate transferase [Bacillota bacterium]
MYKYYIPFFAALLIAYFSVPFAKKIAHKLGAIDIPKDKRRVHKKPIPLLGGLAIYFSTVISFIIFSFSGQLTMDKSLISIIIAATIIVVTGVIDDTKDISAKLKLLMQIIAAFVLIWGDIKITFVSNPFVEGYATIDLKLLSIPVTIFWIVGITNTLNLIDGLDGLAAGVGGIASLSLLFVASTFIGVDPIYGVVMIMASILAGAAFGFLPHNFNPAKIFMGDTGALFLGFMLSVISIRGVMKSFTAVSLVLPIVILGLPICDTAFAIIRRAINKRPIMEADKGHLHHRLLERGLTQKQTVLILYFISISLGGLAVLMTGMDVSQSILTLGITMAIVLLIATQIGVIDMKKRKGINDSERN